MRHRNAVAIGVAAAVTFGTVFAGANAALATPNEYTTVAWEIRGGHVEDALKVPQDLIATSPGANLSAFDGSINDPAYCGKAFQVDVYKNTNDKGQPLSDLLSSGVLLPSHDGAWLAYDISSKPYKTLETPPCTPTPVPTPEPTGEPTTPSSPQPSDSPSTPSEEPTPSDSPTPTTPSTDSTPSPSPTGTPEPTTAPTTPTTTPTGSTTAPALPAPPATPSPATSGTASPSTAQPTGATTSTAPAQSQSQTPGTGSRTDLAYTGTDTRALVMGLGAALLVILLGIIALAWNRKVRQ